MKLQNIIDDKTVWPIIISNLTTIVFAILGKWNVFEIMLVYWLQSIIIGLFNIIHILLLKEFAIDGHLNISRLIRLGIAALFTVHYSIFHFVYIMFLFYLGFNESISTLTGVLLSQLPLTLLFFFSYLYDFIKNDMKDSKATLGSLMFKPYVRIIPMHLTIIFGMGFNYILGGGTLVIFMFLKTIVDIMIRSKEQSIQG